MASTTRMLAPKVASLMGSASAKVARPMMRTNMKVPTQRAFSGKISHNDLPKQQLTAQKGVSSGLRSSTKNAFQTTKRQQVSSILNATTRNAMGRRAYSSEIANAMVEVSQNLGMGTAAVGLGGAGIGIGMVFAALILAVARNPSMRGQLFSYAILGFAFVEAMGLFDLMVAMMAKYV